MWLQLIKPYRIVEPGGKPTMHEPGEMLSMKNKNEAKKLIQDGFAVDVAGGQGSTPEGCGVAVRGPIDRTPHWIEALDLGCQSVKGVAELPYAVTILWHPKYPPNCLQLMATFKTMRAYAWDLAVPIKSYAKLVNDIGTEVDRAKTKTMIHDLRVPYYNTHLLFIKRNDITKALVHTWHKELSKGGDECLAFMRALYTIKPLILALPVDAVRGRAA